jgi:hypothetical protein
MKVALIAWLATRPINSLVDVPLLPISSAFCGCSNPPTPTPWIRHSPSPVRSIVAPIARIAAAVASTSSPSSKPVTRLSPTASAESISERWLIDLSPGTRTVPRKGPDRAKVRGWGVLPCIAGALGGAWASCQREILTAQRLCGKGGADLMASCLLASRFS